MWNVIFWSLFLIGYAGFSLWLAKTLLNGIFLAVSVRAKAEQSAARLPRSGNES